MPEVVYTPCPPRLEGVKRAPWVIAFASQPSIFDIEKVVEIPFDEKLVDQIVNVGTLAQRMPIRLRKDACLIYVILE